jgi:hypothetical protein
VTCYTEGFSHFVTSMTAPVASGWSVRAGDRYVLLFDDCHDRAPVAKHRIGREDDAWMI